MVELRALLLKLGVEVDKDAESKADSSIGKIKKAALAAGAAVAAIAGAKKLGTLTTEIATVGDELDKTGKQLGINGEAIQEWRHAAALSGASANEMTGALQKIQKNAFEAANGNKLLGENFAALGVNVKNADGSLKDADQLLTEMSDGFAGLDNQTQKVGLAMSIMGRSGTKLLPLFDEGADGIAKMRKEARELGAVMSEDMIKKSAELIDAQHRQSQAWKGLKIRIAEVVLPTMIKFTNAVVKLIVQMRDPLNRAIKVISFVLNGASAVIRKITSYFGDWGDSMIETEDIISLIGSAMTGLAVLAAAAGLKMAISWVLGSLPLIAMIAIIGLIAVAIGLLIEDFVTFSNGGVSLIGRLIAGFRHWLESLDDIILTVGVFFEKMFMKVFGLSEDTSRKIVAAFLAIPTGLGELAGAVFVFFTDMRDGVVNIFQSVVDFFTNALDKVTNKITETKNKVADTIGLSSLFGSDADKVAANAARIDAKIAAARAVSQQARIGGGAPGANQNNVNSQSSASNVIVNVDARGQTSPTAIANMTADKVSQASNRQAAKAFGVSR